MLILIDECCCWYTYSRGTWPDCTCDSANMSAVKPQGIITLLHKKKLHVFIFKSLMGRQVLKQTGNSGMDTDNKQMQVRNKTKQAVLWAARTGDNTEITRTRWRCTLSTSFSGSVGATVTVMSEPPLNIPAQVNISTKIRSVPFKGSALVWNSSLQMGQSSSHQDREL